MPTNRIPPGDLAILDQNAALLRAIVADAAAHMSRCPMEPPGKCLGSNAASAIENLSRHAALALLFEAVAQLAPLGRTDAQPR